MPITLFKILWPFLRGYLGRKAADRAAVYLQKRRERRLASAVNIEESDSSRGDDTDDDASRGIQKHSFWTPANLFSREPVIPVQVPVCPPASSSFSRANAIWYSLSGALLGTALSLILIQIFRQED